MPNQQTFRASVIAKATALGSTKADARLAVDLYWLLNDVKRDQPQRPFPSPDLLAALLACTPESAKQSVRRLRQLGLLQKRRNHKNELWWLVPSNWWLSPPEGWHP